MNVLHHHPPPVLDTGYSGDLTASGIKFQSTGESVIGDAVRTHTASVCNVR